MEALQNANQSMENQIDELTKKLQEVKLIFLISLLSKDFFKIREKEVKLKLEFNEEAMQRDKLVDMYKVLKKILTFFKKINF